MYWLEKIVVTIILLFCNYKISVSDSAMRYYDKKFSEESYYDRKVYGKFLKTDPNSFFYIIYNIDNNKINYDVGVDTWVFENGTLEGSCSFTFYVGENREFVGKSRMAPITESRISFAFSVVVGIENESKLIENYYLINDLKDCTTTNITVSDGKPFAWEFLGRYLLPPIVYDNSYEVILVNKALCGTDEPCRLNFDFNGKFIGAYEFNLPSYLKNFAYYVHAVNNSSPEKGVYVCASNDDFYRKKDGNLSNIELFHLNEKGESTKITEIKMIDVYLNNGIVSSSSHELYSMCWRLLTSSDNSTYEETNKIQCIQTDTKTVKVNITLEFKESVNWLMVDSLPGGGMVLISGHCKIVTWDCPGFQILTINADGSKNRLLKVEGHKFDCMPTYFLRFEEYEFQIFDNGDEVCFNIACDLGTLSYSRNCIKKKFIFVSFR